MKTSFLIICLFLITKSICQNTYYTIYSNDIENICSGISIRDSNIFISQIMSTDILKGTTITKFSKNGNFITKLEYKNIDPTKFSVFGYDYAFNRFKEFGSKFLVSGHKFGNDQETKFHIFNTDLIDQEEFNITSANAERIGNEGIYVEDSILYSYGLLQKEKVLYANIIKYNLNTKTIIWDKNYKKGKRLNQMWDFQKTHNGNFVFIIYHKDSDAGSGSNSGYQIIKINPEGDILDTFSYDDPSIDKQRLLTSKEGAIYFTTENNLLAPIIPTDGRINKLSLDMDTILWSLELPSNAFTNGNRYEIFDYIQASNGDIMACGKVWHMPGGPLVAGPNATWNGFVVRVSQDGVLKWSRIYRLPNDNPKLPNVEYGNFRAGQLDKILETEDGNFVLGGTAYYSSVQLNSGQLKFGDTLSSMWLMVVDENGCIEGEECDDVVHLDSNKKLSAPSLLVSDKVTWTESESPFSAPDISSKKYGFSADSFLVKGKYYKQLIYAETENDPLNILTKRYFREENQKVFKLQFDSTEIILYDFNLLPKDTFRTIRESEIIKYIVINTSTISLSNNAIRKSLLLRCADDPDGHNYGDIIWIEGIGSMRGFESPPNTCFTDWATIFNCHYINGNIIYMNPESSDCFPVTTVDISTSHIKIIPNPTNRVIEIVSNVNFDKTVIYDLMGRTLFSQSNTNIMDISGLQNGSYIIEFINKGNILNRQKLIKID